MRLQMSIKIYSLTRIVIQVFGEDIAKIQLKSEIPKIYPIFLEIYICQLFVFIPNCPLVISTINQS